MPTTRDELLERFPSLQEATPSDWHCPRIVAAWMATALTGWRQWGLCGHWAYDATRHAAAYRTYRRYIQENGLQS